LHQIEAAHARKPNEIWENIGSLECEPIAELRIRRGLRLSDFGWIETFLLGSEFAGFSADGRGKVLRSMELAPVPFCDKHRGPLSQFIERMSFVAWPHPDN
jgi:hypothetical protein